MVSIMNEQAESTLVAHWYTPSVPETYETCFGMIGNVNSQLNHAENE
jgi:hypothetical protein